MLNWQRMSASTKHRTILSRILWALCWLSPTPQIVICAFGRGTILCLDRISFNFVLTSKKKHDAQVIYFCKMNTMSGSNPSRKFRLPRPMLGLKLPDRIRIGDPKSKSAGAMTLLGMKPEDTQKSYTVPTRRRKLELYRCPFGWLPPIWLQKCSGQVSH